MRELDQQRNIDQKAIAFWAGRVQASRKNPWLASLLIRRARYDRDRLVYFYRRLASLPRRWRRRLQRGLAGGLLGAALLLAMGSAPSVHAASITVGGACSLIEAIGNANDTTTGQPNADCAAGSPSGADTITLSGGTYTYSAAYSTYNALPVITSEITIEGGGATINRTGLTTYFRILEVGAAGNLSLNQVTISGGKFFVDEDGAGIKNSGVLTLNSSTVSGNSLISSYAAGGGIFNSGSLNLYNSTVSGNSIGGDGAGIYSSGTLNMNSSTVSGNGTDSYGGGLYSKGSTTINNSTISGGSAYKGAGIYAKSGTTTLNNSTISGTTIGGGIVQAGGTLNLNHTLISGNDFQYGTGNEVARLGGTLNADNYNLFGHNGQTDAQAVGGFTPGASDITATSDGTTPTALAAILNTALSNNGGPTLTHALVSGSPAVDASPSGLSTDQRAVVRPLDGDGSGSAASDIGAFELGTIICGIQAAGEPAAYPFGDMSVTITDDGTDLDCLRATNLPHAHPGAVSGTDTGQFWDIAGLQSNEVTPATVDFVFNLTLPHNVSSAAMASVCKNTGGSTWDCAKTGADATTVWRDGITSGFSDWVVGDNVPTAVSLQSFSASSGMAQTGIAGAVLAGAATVILALRRLIMR